MHISLCRLPAKMLFSLCRHHALNRKPVPGFETCSGHPQFAIKIFLHVFIKGHTRYLFNDLAEKNEVIITIDVFIRRTQWTFQDTFKEGVLPVITQVYIFCYANGKSRF